MFVGPGIKIGLWCNIISSSGLEKVFYMPHIFAIFSKRFFINAEKGEKSFLFSVKVFFHFLDKK